MAVGFIIVAAYRIGKKVITDKMTVILFLIGAITTYLIRSPWVFPVVLIIGGFTSVLLSKENNLWNRVKLNPPWFYIVAFIVIALGSIGLNLIWNNRIFELFESFYRYGYLVFGGGQVVVPVMYSELVEINQYMTNQEFLTGYGLVQGLPGPMFSFSAYAGGMAAKDGGALIQTLAALLSGIGIFLPGLLLIYFVYPIWENLKKIKGIKVSLKGINAVAGGLIFIAAVILMQRSGFQIENLIVMVISIMVLISKRIPAPILVLATLLAGFVF
jgi:chromate transporter